MRKSLRLLTVGALVAGSFSMAAPAHAWTCAVADDTADYVVCDVVFPTVVGTACRAVEKWADCVK